MKILGEPEKNQNTGENEILIRLTYREVDLIKSAVTKYKGDVDDSEQTEILEDVRQKLLECKGMLKP